ncbi:MAG: symmetrical bis(5'-nucleosyl)-tetraphosphatase [Gammaproteobacteria bacterium]
MAVYAVGDIHGCLRTLQDLLARIAFSPARDSLWLTGDLVNRGPDSLGVLRWARANQHCITAVLGNHDLHLLAARFGARPAGDSLRAVLDAPDAEELLTWLRARPLMHAEGDYALLHAGRLPEWEQAQTEDLAAETAAQIQNDDGFFGEMFGNSPARWHPALSAPARRRAVVNALTRLRIIGADGEMILNYAGAPRNRPPKSAPWFDVPHRRRWTATAVCGHWSALGLLLRQDLAAIDGGCLWGGTLAALRLEDRKIFQVAAHPEDSAKLP